MTALSSIGIFESAGDSRRTNRLGCMFFADKVPRFENVVEVEDAQSQGNLAVSWIQTVSRTCFSAGRISVLSLTLLTRHVIGSASWLGFPTSK